MNKPLFPKPPFTTELKTTCSVLALMAGLSAASRPLTRR